MLKEKCSGCFHSIPNPVCELCLIRQTKAWLNSIDMTAVPIDYLVSLMMRNLSPDSTNEATCIFCNRHVDICADCFVKKSSQAFIKIGLPEEFIYSFQALFSYPSKKSLNRIH
jgi:hypothetical protein